MYQHQSCRFFRLLGRDVAGAVLPFVAVLLPVMMAVIGLVVDGTRLFILNTEQQDLADAAAIAGARELDGEDDALTRATYAAYSAVSNDTRWANDPDPEAQISRIRFCSSLTGPSHRRECEETLDPGEATFIEVFAAPRRVAPSFLLAVGAVSEPQTSAIAIAGSDIVACKVQPLMLCNPYEPDEFHAEPGQMFHFKQKENTPSDGNWFSPGDFALLDPPGQDSSTGPELRRLLAQQDPNFCYISRVSPRPGQNVGNINDGINVRFDLPLTGNTHGMDQTPAPDVIKGMRSKNNNCNYSGNNLIDTPSARLPRDTDLATPAGVRNLRIGSGNMSTADKNAYWNYHYGTDWPNDIATRYGAYMRELGSDGYTAPTVTGPENRPPRCAAASVRNNGDYRRRIISIAIVNCLQEGVRGNSQNDVRSGTYADFFVTEPASGGEIYAEFVKMFKAGDDDARLYRIVQLYR